MWDAVSLLFFAQREMVMNLVLGVLCAFAAAQESAAPPKQDDVKRIDDELKKLREEVRQLRDRAQLLDPLEQVKPITEFVCPQGHIHAQPPPGGKCAICQEQVEER